MASHSVQIDQASDFDLCRRVRNLLSASDSLRRLQIDVLNGVVCLNGSVHTFYEKQLAANGCQRVAGVRGIDNQVVVAAEEIIA